MTYVFTPETLSGSLVLEMRQRHKLSRAEFSTRAGFTGKSTARLSNIELKESWKEGDREAVARVLNELTGGRFDPRYYGQIIEDTVVNAAPQPVSVLVDADDVDLEDDLLAHAERPIEVVVEPEIESRDVIEIPLIELVPDEAVDPDAYRISNGELQSWKRCRRRWWLGWYRGLTLRTEDFVNVRAIGTRIHRALERWYVPEGQPRVDPRDALERVIVEDWTRVTQLARERRMPEEQLADLAHKFGDVNNLERAMIEGYVQWLEETGADAELRVTAPETPIGADLETVVDGKERPVRVIGLLDVRVRRVTDNRRLFLDHKTVGDLSSPAVTLPLNEQMLHYDLLEFLNSEDGDDRCDGALYNMLRRVKRSARANPPFYGRVEVHHNVTELQSYKRRMLSATADVISATDALDAGQHHLDVAYPSPRSECSWDCDFFAVCNMLDDGSPGVEDMIDMIYRRYDPRDRYDKTDGKVK